MAHYTKIFQKKYNRVRFFCQVTAWVAAYAEACELLDVAITRGEIVMAQLLIESIEDYCNDKGIFYEPSSN